MAKKAAQSATTPKRPAKRRPVKPKPKPETSPPERVEQSSGPRLRSVVVALMAFGVGIIIGVLLAGGIRIDGGSIGPKDAVAQSFDEYETLWRKAQGELAARLESGQIASESAATEWFSKTNTEARRLAFEDVLKKEAAEFGGDKWTAEKHATAIRRYVR